MKKLIENPDVFKLKDGREIKYNSEDSYAFGYIKNKLYISNLMETHHEMVVRHGFDFTGEARDIFSYAGRIWPKSKIISFWKYPPNRSKLKKIVDELSDGLYDKDKKLGKLDIWNDFKMDIIVNPNTGKTFNKYIGFFGEVPRNYETDIINVKDYKSSLKRSKEDLYSPHLMTPIEKKAFGIKRAPGFGAEKRYKLSNIYKDKIGKAYDLNDIPPFLKHQLQYTSDSIIKLKNLVENTIAKLSKRINVKIDIDKTAHAGERQFRPEGYISDAEIIEVVNLALPEIANQLMFDKINMGSYVLIKQISTDINIVGVLHPGQNDEIDFVVVTVMKKKNFIPKRGTKIIGV